MIQQIFGVANESYEIIWYKQKILIPGTKANKKLNTIADKTINVDKERDIIADKKLNIAADKTINANKKQDVAASKKLNTVAELLMFIKDQITGQIKLKD